MPKDSKDYLTTSEVASLCLRSEEWVRQQIRKGKIPALRRLNEGILDGREGTEDYRVPIEDFIRVAEQLRLPSPDEVKIRILAKHMGISRRYAKKLLHERYGSDDT